MVMQIHRYLLDISRPLQRLLKSLAFIESHEVINAQVYFFDAVLSRQVDTAADRDSLYFDDLRTPEFDYV